MAFDDADFDPVKFFVYCGKRWRTWTKKVDKMEHQLRPTVGTRQQEQGWVMVRHDNCVRRCQDYRVRHQPLEG